MNRPSRPDPLRRPRRPGPACLGFLRAGLMLLGLLLAVIPVSSRAIERPVSIAVYQGQVREGDFPGNLSTVRSVIARAREQGVQFLAFPECFLSGYESRAAVAAGARSLEDPDLQEFIRETAEHDLVVVVGLARRNGQRLFNSALVIQQGRLLGTYDKIHLTPDDRNVLGFAPGTSTPVFRAHGVRFGVLICADTSYLQAALAERLQGAELIFTPHYNEIAEPVADDHRRWVRNCHVGLAAQLRVAVARPNVVKTMRPGQVGYGDSFILSPQGEPLAEAKLFKAGLVTATLGPDHFRSPHVWGDLPDSPGWLGHQLARQWDNFRRPGTDADLRAWLENMLIHHRFSTAEAALATGLTPPEITAASQRLGILSQRPQPLAAGAPLKVLPYPGGRHPRLGFFEGAIAPQRETKVSVFPPWDDGGYVVVDVPEAIFSNLGLTYLAHTHIPTIWDDRGVELPRLEWIRHDDGHLSHARTLPNGIGFHVLVEPRPDGVRFELSLTNGTPEALTGLRVQNCVMLGRSPGFEAQSLTNKVFASPFSAARAADGPRWVITGWERCQRTWGNEWVPCIHADPVFPDCPPGGASKLRGWVSFFEGPEIGPELDRLRTTGVLAR